MSIYEDCDAAGPNRSVLRQKFAICLAAYGALSAHQNLIPRERNIREDIYVYLYI